MTLPISSQLLAQRLHAANASILRNERRRNKSIVFKLNLLKNKDFRPTVLHIDNANTKSRSLIPPKEYKKVELWLRTVELELSTESADCKVKEIV